MYKRLSTSCSTCGKSISVLPNALKRRPDQYCSPECGRAGQAKKISAVERQATHWRTRAKRLYGSVCSICGFSLVVEVHHIVPRSRGGGNHDDNLIPLCPNHHAMAHAGMLSEDEMRSARKNPAP